ncbi:MAG: hypothetical protein IJO52_03130 [Clostridia bacterium]|nr:hypothetical protein [Clostridia bacterium]
MNIRKIMQSKTAESVKLALIVILFCSMLFLFYRYTEEKMRSVGGFAIGGEQVFPADKQWIFTGDTYRASLAEAESPYIFPSSIAFRSNNITFSVSGQKNQLVTVYNDLTGYVSEILSPSYSAEKVPYNDYISAIKQSEYILISYAYDFSAYILRIYCDRTATDGFYNGDICKIKKILLVEGENDKLCAYTVDSDNNAMYFSPTEKHISSASDYSVAKAIPIAYTESKMLVASSMSFESEFFSKPECGMASDIVFTPDMQFYETGIINPVEFVGSFSKEEEILKNDKILSVLKSFHVNTGLVRYYTDNNVIYFVDRNAELEISSKGKIVYNGENGGLALSKILNNSAVEFSFADKLTAAVALMNSISRDIICGSGGLMLSYISYNDTEDVLTFEFTYTFDTIPFSSIDKISVEIGKDSVIHASIPTYNFYRYSTRKIPLISPEISYVITNVPQNVFIGDYRPEYVLSEKGNTASVAWVAVTNNSENND